MTRTPGFVALAAMAALVVVATASPQDVRPAAGSVMRDAARALLAAVPNTEHGNFVTDFASEERLNWAYTPVPRKGWPLLYFEQQEQKEAVWALVDTGLGERGRELARAIVTLEGVLFEAADGDDRRDPGRYFVTLFGAPGSLGRWGWRFEGHHLSLNFTILDGQVVGTTPAFFGGSPAHVREGPRAGLRPFAAEETRARAFLEALDPEAREEAILSAAAPRDVLTSNDVPAARPPLLGVRFGDLDVDRRAEMLALLEMYASRLPTDLAEEQLRRIETAGLDELRFAWAGSVLPGEPHYYRIQGPSFVVEYDNTQNDANHVHTVWRDFERDFGRDPLREHLAAAHAGSEDPHAHAR